MFGLKSRRNLIGLDIGSQAIKAIQLKRVGNALQLAGMAMVDIPIEVQEEPDVALRTERVIELIRRLLQENEFAAKDSVTAIAGDSVIVRYVKLPSMSREELKNVIHVEAEQYIPLSIDQVVLDFEVLGEIEEDGQKKSEVLLVAVKEEVVDAHLLLVKAAGLKPAIIDVDSFALENAFEWNYGKLEGETIGLINIGAKLTSINILEDGITHLTRDVAVAGNNFTREIQRTLDVPLAEAERMKRRDGQVLIESEDIMQMEIPKKDDPASRIGEAIGPLLNKLVAEIQRSLDYYESTIRKKPITRIFLSGGACRLKNLDKFLAEKLNVGVEFTDPFKRIVIPEKDFDPAYVADQAAVFAVGVGLALRQME